MKVVITDANIFIDLFEMDLLEGFFKLPYTISTSVFILEELDDIKPLVEKVVNVIPVTDQDITAMSQIDWPKPFSFPDRTILYLAQVHQMMVLSGERRMMAWCKKNALEGHGLLYILDAMITNKVYKPKTVSKKLRILMGYNMWLPTDLCEEMMQRWEEY
jgi:hypothetical protein